MIKLLKSQRRLSMKRLLQVNVSPKQSVPKKRKNLYINRFNTPLEESKYLDTYQKMLIEKLILNKQKRFCYKNINRIIKNILNRNADVNLSIKGGLLLSCKIEAEEFVMLQETNKKLFGKYVPIDEVLQLLISWYIYYYHPNNKNKKLLPMMERKNTTRYTKLNKFENKFKKYYHNII